jgi:PAS domain S-box-containing protein
LRHDGQFRYNLFRLNPFKDERGNVIRWYATVTDIEDRKRAEERIREQEAELRQMLDLTPQCLAVLGADGSPIYANRASLDYLGMTQDEWKQSGAIDGMVHPDDEERLARASSTSSAYELELRVRTGEGGFRWFLSRFSPLLDEKGQITRWYIASTDIEDRKRAEERLEKENAALREEVVQASMFEEIVGTFSGSEMCTLTHFQGCADQLHGPYHG